MKIMKKYVMMLAVGVMVCACGSETAERPLHSVMVTTPVSEGGETVKNFSGIVRENAETSLGFKTGGQIEQILVKEGDHVRRGQLLARLDAKDYRLGVEALQIQYDQTKAEVERMRQLYEGRSLSGNDYEKAVSGLRQLEVQLQVEKNKLSYTSLYAPEDGIVQRVNFERAEMVNAGTPVFSLLDVRRMEVEISLPQNIYQQRDRFGSIYCTADGQQYVLRLVSIVPKADNNQLYSAKLSIDGKLNAGQTVDVVICLNNEKAASFTLPLHSVFEYEGKSCVWTVGKDSTVSRQVIIVGGTDDQGNVIVTSGLQGTETIVRAGVHALTDKEKVKIFAEPSETNIGGLI